LPKPNLPFWISPPSRGSDKDGKSFHAWIVAASRETRKKKSATIRLYDVMLSKLTQEQGTKMLTDRIFTAARELGLIPDVVVASKIAMLHGWDPKAKPPPQLVIATH
jgi:hypothetical protein